MPKPLEFLGDSLDVLKSFPAPVIKQMGHELNEVQEGRDPSNWKPMKTVGPGVREIRVSFDGDAFRTIYTVKVGDTIYVLHVFQKKTKKTSNQDIERARKRLKELTDYLQQEEKNHEKRPRKS